LADDSVKNATGGDFVKITGDIYLIIKTSPTVLGSVVALTLLPALKVVNGNFGKYAISMPVVTGTPGKL
jgi:phenolic acid decarboxylase